MHDAAETSAGTVAADHAAADVARRSYARLLAILAARDGDIVAAEDCLSDAFTQALTTWPARGIPANPEAWLLTVARNRRRDNQQSAAARLTDRLDDHDLARTPAETVAALATIDADEIPDRRLALMFVCAHPAIDSSARTPLMLQTVMGFDADAIARAFAVPTATMAQRLVRAKRRIRDARIPFVVPERAPVDGRLAAVLEAIYGAYAIEYPLVAGETQRESLSHEALYLARLLAELMPSEPEVLGLAALLALSLARRSAMQSSGRFIPLDEQDVSRWDGALIAEGERLLAQARVAHANVTHDAHGGIASTSAGRFEIEAAIQSAHSARIHGRETDWNRVLELHTSLLRVASTLGARVAHAATVGRVHGAAAGLIALDSIERELGGASAVGRFQPWWAARAHLLVQWGDLTMARDAYARCIALTADPLLRAWLNARVASLPDSEVDAKI